MIMKKKIVFIVLIFASAFSVINAQSDKIVWEKDVKKAQALARQTGKPMLLDFTATWCDPCLAMDKEFWVLRDVAQAVQPFIAVKVDFDSERKLVDKYQVRGIPYVAFTDPIGNLITYRLGFSKRSMSSLTAVFDEMPKDFAPMMKYYDALDAKKDDGVALVNLANSYRSANMLSLSTELYQRAAKTSEVINDADLRESTAAKIGSNLYILKRYDLSSKAFEEYLKIYTKGKNREEIIYGLVLTKINLRKFKDAEKLIEQLKTEFPDSKRIENSKVAIEKAKNK
jgi:thioredoxin-related protein